MANVCGVDRAVRGILGVVLVLLPFIPLTAQALAGMGGWIWAFPVAGAVLIVTAALRFCPAYSLLGIRTCAAQSVRS